MTLMFPPSSDELSHKVEVFPVPPHIEKTAHVTAARYAEQYDLSIKSPDEFWRTQAQRIDWLKFPTKIKNTSFTGDVSIKWYEDGVLNACYNCVDRHVPEHGHETALIWESDDPLVDRHVTFRQLKVEVCRVANALKSLGVKKGDRVTIYMPMVLEAVYAMLACARIGAVHSVVFGGFSSEALRDRIQDCGSSVVITADEGVRGGKIVPLKANVDLAVAGLMDVASVLVYKRTGASVHMKEGRDVYWDDLVDRQSDDCPVEPMNAEDPLFILYTSGSTGKPKGVLHTTGGYLVYASLTHEVTFDARPGDIYWCTADVGWITGHSYIVYGPLANRVATLVFEGIPTYPDAARLWQVVDKHHVNLFYTAPTAIRALIKAGDQFVHGTRRDSLRVLGSVGEPINHEAWIWYHNVVGNGHCPIVDTWWQTETGGHMITPLPGVSALKPGSASRPFFGVKAAIVNGRGEIQHGECHGHLVILDSWPGQMRTLWGNHARFIETYFTTFPGMYCTSDGAKRDKDGDYWITGRVDDVVNVSGHRLGTAEIESAIDEAAGVAESAVVGYPHDIKGQGIYAYVILKEGAGDPAAIKADIIKAVRRMIGPIATPDVIQFTPGLPKTRSGKIMRRILRKIAALEIDHLGDTSTLADPDIVPELVKGRKELTL